MIDTLYVSLWGKKIGTLISSKKGYGQQVCFHFTPEYAKGGIDISPLRAPLSSVVVQRGLPVYPEESKEFGGLPSFIADSLPDYWGNIVFAEWAKAHNIRSKDLSSLDRLAYIGCRGMGALEFAPPATPGLDSPFRVEISELSQFAQRALREANDFHAIIKPDFAIESLFKVGTSAGGRRPKAVININLDTGECYSGQVPAPISGFTPMIIKLDEHAQMPTTRIEYSYYLMATEAGINMMPSMLKECNGEAHFLTQRFDRNGNEKVHTQTLAAMNPLSSSYEDLFDAAVNIGIAPGELKQLFLQMAMNVVGGNVDDHNKNFSFTMDKDGSWHVAPAYDFTFAIDPSAPAYINRHSMTINGKNHGITRADLMEIAARYNVKCASTLIDRAVAAAKHYREHAKKAGVPDPWIIRIEQEIAAFSL